MKTNFKEEEILWLIKTRARFWCQASNLIPNQNFNTNIWCINPVGAISMHFSSLHKGFMDYSDAIFEFMDGSLVIDSGKKYFAGIGGYFKDNENNYYSSFLVPHILNWCLW